MNRNAPDLLYFVNREFNLRMPDGAIDFLVVQVVGRIDSVHASISESKFLLVEARKAAIAYA